MEGRTSGSPSRQAVLSSYFPAASPQEKGKKRASSVIDLTIEDEGSMPQKRPKTGEIQHVETPPRSMDATQLWRYVPPSPDKPLNVVQPHQPRDDEAKRKRHEAFKKKLLAENSIFVRRNSDNQPDAIMVDPEENEADPDQGSDDSADADFRTLTASFENKSGTKGPQSMRSQTRGSTSTSRRKKNLEVGPSGQTFTPLELQVEPKQLILHQTLIIYTGPPAQAG